MSKRARSIVPDETNEPQRSLSDIEGDLDTTKRIELERRTRDIGAVPVVTCTLPPICNAKPHNFYKLDQFEAHYQKHHCHICHECLANFPTNQFLELHIEENHDPFFPARLDRGEKVYRCFSEYCSIRFSSSSSRRRHLENDHQYPPEFRFNIVQRGLGKRTQSLLYSVKTQPGLDKEILQSSCLASDDRAGVPETEAGRATLNRAQRRAQAKQENEASELIMPPEDVMETTFSLESKADKKTNPVRVDAKAEHAKAVQALFETLKDPDTLEPEHALGEDHDMDDLASALSGAKIMVPTQIKFGSRRR